ncbi:transglutaminaseTgpA domain-containing protein [Cellulomonas massiliensis]|uniref:transglutaminase family protein n=1 Tax=Cellulomonas massiliensis TaxID=1465811 RepID=UPI0002D2BA06|nr:transglutaminase domain-containing protein [Cellulomonas massiliensis]
MIGVRTPGRALVDVLCLVGTLALALVPLLEVYGGLVALPAIAGGLLLGTAAGVVGAWRRWTALGTVAVLVVAFLLAGGALAAPTTTVAGVVPTLETLETLATGTVTSWKYALTLQPPVGAGGGVLVAPLLLALVGSAAATSTALRVRRGSVAGLATVAPVLVTVGAIVLGLRFPTVPPLVTGLVLVGVLLPWASWRAGTLRLRRVLAVTVMGAVVGAAGAFAGPAVAGQHERFVVRDEIVPPFDPRDYPSPLAAYRAFVKKYEDTTLFTVEGLPDDGRVRLATLDRYDGTVWNVSGAGAQSSGEFRRVGRTIEQPARGEEARVRVQVQGLSGVWLPTVGEARSITLAPRDQADLRYNDATGAAVLTRGVRPGLTYTLDAVVPRVPDDDDIGTAPAADVTQPDLAGVPDVVAVTAADVARDAGQPVEVARALADWLSQEGFFSDGLEEGGVSSSLSGHGASRMITLLSGDLMVGDSEQYASAMALMAREMALPARVVMGFVPERPAGEDDGPVEVHGSDVRAWVEVAFAGYGWVPFDPTPPPEQTPDEQDSEKPTDPEPQVVQPPPPPEGAVTPPDEDTEQPSTDEPQDDDGASRVWLLVARVVGIAAIPLLVLAAPFVVVGVLKARRRRRRRRQPDPVRRVAGGWDEVVDAARDLHRSPLGAGTRTEGAHELASAFAQAPAAPQLRASVATLARAADRAVFAGGTPSPDEIDDYWADVASAVDSMTRSVPWRRRWRARLSTLSLRSRRRPSTDRPWERA